MRVALGCLVLLIAVSAVGAIASPETGARLKGSPAGAIAFPGTGASSTEFPVAVAAAETAGTGSADADVAGEAGGPPLDALLPGVWRGMHTAGGATFHHRIEVSKSRRGFVGKGVLWLGMSEAQARAAAARRLRGAHPKAMVVAQTFAVTLEGETVTFRGAGAQPVFGCKGNYHPDVFSGTLKAPGVVTGGAADAGEGGGTFQLWREGALETPLPLDLEAGRTHDLGCVDGGRYHYKVHIPRGYDPATPTPVLINFSPGGRAGPLSKEKADELGWLMAGLAESKNGPVQPSCENAAAVLFDLRRRFKVDPRRAYFSGMSGGSRMASWAAILHAEACAGVIMIAAGQYNGMPDRSKPIFFIIGEKDTMCGDEVRGLYEAEKRAGRRCDIIIHPGGHGWGRKQDHAAAVQWLQDQWAGTATPPAF